MGAEAAVALARLHARAFDAPWSADAFAALLTQPGVIAFVTPGEGDWTGFILARAQAGEAEVLTLAVDPDARRRGLAQALVEAAAVAAAGEGADALFLEVAADNAPALALYAAAGFAPVGRRPAYYSRPNHAHPGAAPVDALVLRRALTRPVA